MALFAISHQEWHDWLHKVLPPPEIRDGAPTAVDLFSGCGGLSLAFETCGFRTVGYEMNTAAVQTYSQNLAGECHEVFLTRGMPEIRNDVDVLIGGPPCQPFSQFGYQRGSDDDRDGFPVFLDAMNRMRPRIAVMENVRGLLYRNKEYLRSVAGEMERLGYEVHAKLLKAVNYGVPQNRERVFVVATRIGWEWPDRFVDEPVTAGAALGRMAYEENEDSRYLKPNMDEYIAAYEAKSGCKTPRDLHLDRPARTVTCRNLGGATADMLRIVTPGGKRRMLTVREGARLQSFPDWFEFIGSEYERCKQIGNAVPPLLGLAIAKQVQKAVESPHHGKAGHMGGKLLDTDMITEKVEQAINIFRLIGVPVRDYTRHRQVRLAKALLAVAGVMPGMKWSDTTSHFDGSAKPLTTREIIKIWNSEYDENLADSSYDDVRRIELAILKEAGLVTGSAADPVADVNDGTRGYSITPEALDLLRGYGTEKWEDSLLRFRSDAGELKDRLSKARDLKKVPVTLPDGNRYNLSPGPHNMIQRAVIEDFLPRFSRGAEVLYIGDATKKILHIDADRIRGLGVDEMSRETLPDILAYESERDWLFVIEAVHSSNPIDSMRHLALRRLTRNSTAGVLFVSAFENASRFARFSKRISWETEVWIADDPEHMIHFDGGRYLAPYKNTETKTSTGDVR